jgi:glycosyltransferase involved in cell wall biosynthesis
VSELVSESRAQARQAASARPAVSVVMCVVDPDPRYFLQAVRSILGQTLHELELLVIEEPSAASAGKLLAELSDPRLRHDLHPTRTSLVQQRNRGLSLARAELIAVLDADDIAEPTRLEKQVAYLERHPEVGVLGSQLQLIDAEGASLGYRRYPTAPVDVLRTLSRWNPIAQPAVVYRKAAAQAVGGYHDSRLPATDYDLWCRMALAGTQLANLDEALVRYRIHAGGMKTQKLRETLEATIEIKQRHFGSRMQLGDKLRLLAERALLQLPPALVMRLFLATTASPRAVRKGAS